MALPGDRTKSTLFEGREELIKKTVNPFECKAPWTPYEIFKAIILFPTLFPIRLVLLMVSGLVMSLWCLLVSCGGTKMINDRGCLRHEEPMPKWRLWLLGGPCRICIRICLWSFGFWYIKCDDRRRPTRKFDGQIVEGDDLEKKTMTVAAAQRYCLRLPRCKGFSFQGADNGKPMEITFKSEFKLAKDDRSEGWTSYRVEPKPGVIAMAPHPSCFDAFIAASVFPPVPSEVGKIDLLDGAMGVMLGSIAIASQGIFVRREEKSSREACKDAIAARADPSWTGPPTLICPEGTCTNGKVLVMFKLGPFLPGKPVTPVALSYPHKHFEIAWTGRFAHDMGSLVLRSMLQFVNHCSVTIFEPYVPSDEEVANPQLFANNVRSVIGDHLGIGTTEHSYADSAFSMKALKAGVANDFEVDDVKKTYGITPDKLVEWLQAFKKNDDDHSGFISEKEFASSMEGMPTEVVTKLFELFDTEQTGQLSYRECIQALALINYEKDSTGRDKLCFTLCNPDASGIVNKGALEMILESTWTGDAAKLKEILASVPEKVNFQEFAKISAKDPKVSFTILSTVPEKFRPTRSSPAFAGRLSNRNEVEMIQQVA